MPVQVACNPPAQLLPAPFEPDLHHPTSASHTKPVIMAARTRKAEVPLVDDGIDILNEIAAEASPANKVFRTASAILALVRVGAPVLLPPVNYRI